VTPPDWANILGSDYELFRAALVEELERMKLTVDHDHIDCGVLHTKSGTLGLSNIVRLCHPAPRDRWPAIIAEHLRRSTAQRVAMAFELAGPRLRLRLVPDRLLALHPEKYVARELAPGLHITVAIDNPEHVVFVNPPELAEWDKSADDVFAIATTNTQNEPMLDRHDIEIPDAPPITALVGDSYFAASHALFLERYFEVAPNGHLVAMPDRHALFVLPLASASCLAGFGPLVALAHSRFTEEPGAITDQLYWRRGDRFVKVACGVRADGTPWVAPPDDFNELVGQLAR
jgi:hypothetical protein